MLADPKTSHGPYDSERLLIAMTTRSATLRVSCVRPPNEREVEFREVLADYERRKDTRRQLKPLFSIPKPFALLTYDESRAFVEDRTRPFAVQRDERLRGVSDLFRLADVYFDQRGRLALTGLLG
jgi:hypothetical protein